MSKISNARSAGEAEKDALGNAGARLDEDRVQPDDDLGDVDLAYPDKVAASPLACRAGSQSTSSISVAAFYAPVSSTSDISQSVVKSFIVSSRACSIKP